MENPDLIQSFRRFLDYQAYFAKLWLDECIKEGHSGGTTQKIYQHHHNMLISMRERTTEEYLLKFLDSTKFDMPEAKEMI